MQLYTPAEKSAIETGLAKIAAMTPAEKDRDSRLCRAWLDAAAEEYVSGKMGRANRICDAAGQGDKTFSEVTNGVMPDGGRI